MRKLLLLLAVTLLAAPAASAQNTYSDWEFFIGYAHERASNGADHLDQRGLAVSSTGATSRVDFVNKKIPYNGVTGEVVVNLNSTVGLVGNFSATFANTQLHDQLSGRNFNARMSRYTMLFGPRFNWRNDSIFTPFAHALFGATVHHASVDNFSCPDKNQTGFTMAYGAGLDVEVNDRFDIRPIQVDYMPTYFKGHREDNVRFSAGIKIK
jgi:opacity protein-like surface antigen